MSDTIDMYSDGKLSDFEKEKIKILTEEFKIQKTEINLYLNAQIQLMNITLVAIGAMLTAIDKLGSFSIHLSGLASLVFFAIYLSQLRYTNTICELSNHIVRRLQPGMKYIFTKNTTSDYFPMSWENEGSHHLYRPNDSIFYKLLNYSVQQMRSFIALAAGIVCTSFFITHLEIHATWNKTTISIIALLLAIIFMMILTAYYTRFTLHHVSSNPTSEHDKEFLQLDKL